jgi:hypothetical protein
MFCAFQAKTQSRYTQHAYEGKTQDKNYTRLLEKYAVHIRKLTTYLLRGNPRNKTRPRRMQQEET